jgi:hypothetical protein
MGINLAERYKSALSFKAWVKREGILEEDELAIVPHIISLFILWLHSEEARDTRNKIKQI